MSTSPCPICKRAIETLREINPAAPFCSSRCRSIDLGRWLGESYRIPAVDQDLGTSDIDEPDPISRRPN